MSFLKTGVVALSLAVVGVPAMAQQTGLVNVTIIDAVDVGNVIANVQVPVAIAANICVGNLSVAALAEQVAGGGAECQATADSVANNRQAARIARDAGVQLPG